MNTEICLIATMAGLAVWGLSRFLNSETRVRRRRSRNYGRVVSRRQRPMVRLAVKV